MSAPRKEQLADGVTLYCGDCREVLNDSLCEGAVICDAPYGISHSSNYGASWQRSTIANDGSTEARDWVARWANGCPAVFFGTWKTPPVANTRCCLVWDKGPAFGMGDLSLPWKPSFELAYVCGTGWEGERGEGVLRGPVVVSWESAGRVHPHQKPVWIFEHFIQRLPNYPVVYDPFMGSGSCALAAINRGRKFVGIETDEHHFSTARRRISEALRRPRLPFEEPRKVVQAEMSL